LRLTLARCQGTGTRSLFLAARVSPPAPAAESDYEPARTSDEDRLDAEKTNNPGKNVSHGFFFAPSLNDAKRLSPDLFSFG
jgi:hypothetical protein